ncbi:MAG TPA: hypothetical protein VK658_07800 [Chryseolinea sp.]|nr:hypothetical protein [Chryseolinea sp.]
MRSLLTVTALFEAATGLALAVAPSFVVSILLGSSLTGLPANLVGRLAGAALITIALACWLSRNSIQSSIMVKAMVVYNVFSALLLVYAGLERTSGPGLWPAAVLHVGLLVWCLSSLKKPSQTTV